MEKFMEIINYINSIFYGDYWFVAWGIVLLLFSFFVIPEIPKLVKSFKEAKERGKK